MARDKTTGTAPASRPTARQERVSVFRQQRLAAFRDVEQRVNNGTLSPLAGQEHLRRLGYLPGGAKEKQPTGPLGAAAKAIGTVANVTQKAVTEPVRAIQNQRRQDAQLGAWSKLNDRPLTLDEIAQRGGVHAGVVVGPSLIAQLAGGAAESATYNPGGAVAAVTHPVRTAKELAGNVKEQVQHPFRDPFLTAMTLYAAGSGVAGALERAVAAKGAVSQARFANAAVRAHNDAMSRVTGDFKPPRPMATRSVAKEALTRPGHLGGSLLHKPEPGTYSVYVKGAAPESGIGPVNARTAEIPLSRNYLARETPVVGQKARFARVQQKIDAGAPERKATGLRGFVQSNLTAEAKVGRHIRADRRIEQAGRQAAVTSQQNATHPALGKHLSRGEDNALQVIAAKGERAFTDPERAVQEMIDTHLQHARDGVAPQDNLAAARDLKTALSVLRNPSEKFKRAAAETADLANQTEQQAIKRGYITDAQAQHRKGSYAAAYTPEGRALLAERDRLEQELAGAKAPKNVEKALADTQAKLDKIAAQQKHLEESHARAVAQHAAHVPDDSALAQRESALRSELDTNLAQQAKVRAHRTLTAATKEARLAQLRAAESNLRTAVDDVAAQRAKLNAPRPEPVKPNLDPLRKQESQLRSRIEDLHRHRRLADVNAELRANAPNGGFYFPLSPRYTQTATKVGAGTYNPRPNPEAGIAPPSKSAAMSSKRFTGKSVELGQKPISIADSVAARAAAQNRLQDAEDFYKHLWDIGSPVRTSEHQIPIRDTRQVKTELRDYFKKLHDRLHVTPDQRIELDLREARQIADLLDAAEHRTAHVGGPPIEGVRWVDQRFIKQLGMTKPSEGLLRAVDDFNNLIRGTSLYLRPAYALNLAGNATMQGITQGMFAPKAMKLAVSSVKQQGEPNTALIDSFMQNSRSRSYAVPTGIGAAQNERLAEMWNAITDLYSRRSAFFHEAHKAGFDTPDEISALLHDPAHHGKLLEVVKRANKNMVDYGSLTPLEKDQIRRLIYFYPWVSRATLWTLRTVVEHPGKSWTLAELGKIGADHANQQLGPHIPDWAWQIGLVPAGAQHDGKVPTVNLTSINTPSTAAEAGRAIVGTAERLVGVNSKNGLGDVATPGAAALVTLGGTGDSVKAPGLLGALQSTPQASFVRTLGINNKYVQKVVGKPSKTFPDTGVVPAVERYVAGGAAKRNVDRAELNKQGIAELPGDRRAEIRTFQERTRVYQAAMKAGLLPKGAKLPAELRKAYNIQAQRNARYAKLGTNATQRDRLKADLELGVAIGAFTQADADKALAARLTDAQIKAVRRTINRDMFGGKTISAVKRFLTERGVTVNPPSNGQ